MITAKAIMGKKSWDLSSWMGIKSEDGTVYYIEFDVEEEKLFAYEVIKDQIYMSKRIELEEGGEYNVVEEPITDTAHWQWADESAGSSLSSLDSSMMSPKIKDVPEWSKDMLEGHDALGLDPDMPKTETEMKDLLELTSTSKKEEVKPSKEELEIMSKKSRKRKPKTPAKIMKKKATETKKKLNFEELAAKLTENLSSEILTTSTPEYKEEEDDFDLEQTLEKLTKPKNGSSNKIKRREKSKKNVQKTKRTGLFETKDKQPSVGDEGKDVYAGVGYASDTRSKSETVREKFNPRTRADEDEVRDTHTATTCEAPKSFMEQLGLTKDVQKKKKKKKKKKKNKKKTVVVQAVSESTPSPMVFGDVEALKQVLLNKFISENANILSLLSSMSNEQKSKATTILEAVATSDANNTNIILA